MARLTKPDQRFTFVVCIRYTERVGLAEEMSLNKKEFQIVYAIAATVLLALTNPLAGQDNGIHTPQFTAGIKVGMQTTSVTTGLSPSFDHFTFGPVAEVGLSRRLGLLRILTIIPPGILMIIPTPRGDVFRSF